MKATTDPNSDQELITLCLRGSENAYTALYQRHAKAVFNSIYRLVGNLHEAEDLLQEVFLIVFADLKKLRHIDSMRAWLTRLAINKSISHLRKQKVFFCDIQETVIADTSQEEIEFKKNTEYQIEDIRAAIYQLPLPSRTIVTLFLFEEVPQQEIGKMLGMSHSAVRSQYHRAKRKIMETLKQKLNHV